LLSQEINLLTRKDTVILWGGSNDIAKNEAVSGLGSLRKFVNNKKNTDIVLITAPHRYDLMEFSCVNEEIKIFNRKMHKIMKLKNNVKILDTNVDRSCYTKPGLHLNRIGKERVMERILNQIKTPINKNKQKVIAQYWEHNLEEIDKIRRNDMLLHQEDKDGDKEKEEK
jgi:hypothetical protein